MSEETSRYLAQAIENGTSLDPRGLYTAEEERLMHDALEGYDELALKPVFEQLEGRISYGKLKIYRAMNPRLEDVESSAGSDRSD